MRISSPAKINLFLKVVGKRPDGYHELVSLMCCVGIYDTVNLRVGSGRTTVACGHPDVPEDENNLTVRAADLFLEALGIGAGVHIEIQKRIPVGAGLGGGSSNAAAVFNGLNRHFDNPFTFQQLRSMALTIGADVPFFIRGKPALVTGIGEKLEPFGGLKPMPVLLIYPGVGLSTAGVFKKFNLALTKCEKKIRSILLGDLPFNAVEHLHNDLEATAASICPPINTAKKLLLEHGADGAMMTGSGSTVFGLFFDREQAELARQKLYPEFGRHLFLTTTLV
jgi:4-diphosphocytidyl-2-C-methyl-D-erythritol kinase